MNEAPPPTLRGQSLVLRPATERDVAPLAALLAEPAVARWWGKRDVEWARKELVEPGQGWVVSVDGAVAGWLEYLEESDPDYRHIGLDIFLTTGLHGRGYAHEALRLAIGHFIERGHHASPSIPPSTTSAPSEPTRRSASRRWA